MSRMPAYTTWPASASARTVMAPKPLEAPVTTMVLDILGSSFQSWVAPGRLDDAAVCVQDLAVHPARRAGEERDHLGDVRRRSETLERRHFPQTVDRLLVFAVEEQPCRGRPWGDGVDGDIASAQLLGKDERDRVYATLGRGVGGVARQRDLHDRGREVDDRTSGADTIRCFAVDDEGAAQVGAHHPIQDVEVEVCEWGERHDPGRVDDNVDASVA